MKREIERGRSRIDRREKVDCAKKEKKTLHEVENVCAFTLLFAILLETDLHGSRHERDTSRRAGRIYFYASPLCRRAAEKDESLAQRGGGGEREAPPSNRRNDGNRNGAVNGRRD